MSDRKLILKMLQENRISIEEAEQLLSALETKSAPETPRENAQSNPASQIFEKAGPIFDKAGPKVEQMMGSLGSLFDSVSQTVSQQLGQNFEKKVEGWFQQRQKPGEAVFEEVNSQEDVIAVESGTQKLRCFHKLGELVVEGYEGNQIQAVLEKHISTQRVEDKLRYEELKLTSRLDGTTLQLEIGGAEQVKSQECRIKLMLRVPAALHLDLRTTSGNILLSQVSRAQGQVRLESESGNLTVRSVALQRIDLQTRSGDVVIDQASEQLQIQTASGDIKLKGTVYEAQLESASGQIQIDAGVAHLLKAESRSGDLGLQLLDGAGKLELRSTSGDIELSGSLRAEANLHTVSGDLHCEVSVSAARLGLEAQSGDVDLILRQGSSCKLDVQTGSGDIECRLPLSAEEKAEHSLRGVFGDGAAEIAIKTQSGDVLIS